MTGSYFWSPRLFAFFVSVSPTRGRLRRCFGVCGHVCTGIGVYVCIGVCIRMCSHVWIVSTGLCTLFIMSLDVSVYLGRLVVHRLFFVYVLLGVHSSRRKEFLLKKSGNNRFNIRILTFFFYKTLFFLSSVFVTVVSSLLLQERQKLLLSQDLRSSRTRQVYLSSLCIRNVLNRTLGLC